MNLVGGVFTIEFAGPRPGTFRVATSQPMPTFDAYYIGDARCALVRVAVDDVLSAEPRFPLIVFHGPTGFGKSLLARGLTGLLQQEVEYPPLAYSGSAFARACGLAAETNGLADFRRSFERACAVIIDDVHVLADKPNPQEELLHVIDQCARRGAPVVLTLTHAPQQTQGLLPGLTSRIVGGLNVPLVAPGPDGFRALAKRLAREQGARLDDKTLAQLAAWGSGDGLDETSASSSVKRLRQPTVDQFRRVVTRIAQALVLEAVESKEQDGSGEDSARLAAPEAGQITSHRLQQFLEQEVEATQPDLRAISSTVARYFDQKLEDLRGPARRRELVQARSIAMYLARLLTGKSLGQVGKHFGNRDHTTVLHAYRRVERLIQEDDSVRKAVDELASHFARN